MIAVVTASGTGAEQNNGAVITHEENNLSDDICEAVMRSVIRNMRVLKNDPKNMDSRNELEWASAMAENGILKIGKTSSFQAHQIEHQLGAYTDCNHGQGLAVIHPVLYRRLCKDAPVKFARLAVNVFGVCAENKTEVETALEGVVCLVSVIKEMGLPTTFAEMGIREDTDYRSVADSSNIITNGCFKPLTHDDIYEILMDCRG